MKHIIEYLPGCKGDLLIRSLSGQDIKFEGYNKVVPNRREILKELIGRVEISEEEFTRTLGMLVGRINGAHTLSFVHKGSIHLSLIQRHGFKLKKILFDKRFYRTIYIENVFKNIHHYMPELMSAPHPVNTFNNILTTDAGFYHNFNSIELCYGRDLWNYENLYINFNQRDELFEDFDWETFKGHLEQSWLPESIELFGKTWRPRDYGYRDWE